MTEAQDQPDDGTPTGCRPPSWAESTAPCTTSVPLVRIIDAAANRAREGLRVIEDYLRFALDDHYLTATCKRLRHDLQAALQMISTADRHTARETEADVGARISTASESSRGDPWEVCSASFARVAESLRSLEEYTKVLDPAFGSRFEALRYRSYTLQRVAGVTRESIQQLDHLQLLVLVDGGPSCDEFARLIDALLAARVPAIQLRDKSLSDRYLLDRARVLRRKTDATATLMFINDRPDIAAASHADGVQLGQDDMSVKAARTILGPRTLVGISTHSIQQARQAVDDGANLIGVGPTFRSTTKQFEHFPGLPLLGAVSGEIRLPTFAIGGIDSANIDQVLAAGIRRIAVGAGITSSADPAAAIRQLLAALAAADRK